MRLKISLESVRNEYKLPINYQYPLSAVVYKIFAAGSEQIAEWLHEKGFTDGTGKNLKLFNYSNLLFDWYKINTDSISYKGNCSFLFSTPIETELAEIFVNGLFKLSSFKIGNSKYQNEFSIKSVEMQRMPEFSNEHIFRTLSPVTVSTIIEVNDEKKIYYYRPEDKGFTEAIKSNLIKKYEMVYLKPYTGNLDISIVDGTKPRNKLITIKEGTPEETKIKAFLISLLIKAEPEIMKTAYLCGIGEKGSMGFGMMEII
jgi:CRISPR-associated endoribonuclease Cas6